jgi:hypothetical protein
MLRGGEVEQRGGRGAGEQAGGEARQDPPHEQRGEPLGEQEDDRADGGEGQPRQQDPAAAVPVREMAEQQQPSSTPTPYTA